MEEVNLNDINMPRFLEDDHLDDDEGEEEYEELDEWEVDDEGDNAEFDVDDEKVGFEYDDNNDMEDD
ncbi:hypothetical protein O6P43_013311 [Quillaja saponaria]|uniref:Uncharacterized protein n=1 Tax=Quillaja saponaria TaxID=32244 RepID=A0AAD7M3I7_QUISA|nr:hypothetical protein O6P43_013311 [Quillaja saponaria]